MPLIAWLGSVLLAVGAVTSVAAVLAVACWAVRAWRQDLGPGRA